MMFDTVIDTFFKGVRQEADEERLDRTPSRLDYQSSRGDTVLDQWSSGIVRYLHFHMTSFMSDFHD